MTTALEMKREEWHRFNPAKNITVRIAKGEGIKRREKALAVAKQAASILRQQFGAYKVVAFGSLLSGEMFSSWSDIDLAAWGIEADSFYSAVAVVTGLSTEFNIDLVEPDTCRKVIKETIQKHGIEI
jgi:predicted nucleotidyltransferase